MSMRRLVPVISHGMRNLRASYRIAPDKLRHHPPQHVLNFSVSASPATTKQASNEAEANVTITKVSMSKIELKKEEVVKIDACGDVEKDDEEDEMEDMFIEGPAGMEWGGPTRGGRHKEPTRYGDWERKGRCTDFS